MISNSTGQFYSYGKIIVFYLCSLPKGLPEEDCCVCFFFREADVKLVGTAWVTTLNHVGDQAVNYRLFTDCRSAFCLHKKCETGCRVILQMQFLSCCRMMGCSAETLKVITNWKFQLQHPVIDLYCSYSQTSCYATGFSHTKSKDPFLFFLFYFSIIFKGGVGILRYSKLLFQHPPATEVYSGYLMLMIFYQTILMYFLSPSFFLLSPSISAAEGC